MSTDNHEHDHEHEFDMEESIVVMTDDEGNERYYREEAIFPVGENTYAVLVELQLGEDGDVADIEGEPEVFMAKVVIDETGEETYVDPTDEEFDAAIEAYGEMFEEDEEDEE